MTMASQHSNRNLPKTVVFTYDKSLAVRINKITGMRINLGSKNKHVQRGKYGKRKKIKHFLYSSTNNVKSGILQTLTR